MNLMGINKIYLFRHSMLLTKCSYIVIKVIKVPYMCWNLTIKLNANFVRSYYLVIWLIKKII